MSFFRGASGVHRMEGESNEAVSLGFVMYSKGEGMNSTVVKIVKCRSLRWFELLERIKDTEMAKGI